MSSGLSVFIGSDHAGVSLKTSLKKLLSDIHWTDIGVQSPASVDYPKIAFELTTALMAAGSQNLGILICGSGIGMSIAANKVRGIRAAVVSDPISARLAREHNHANVLCLGARFLAPEYAAEIIRAWVGATPSLETRHTHRVEMMEKSQ